MLAVDQGEKARFFALQILLDDDLCTRLAEGTTEARLDRFLCSFFRFGDDDPLSSRQSIGLHDQRQGMACCIGLCGFGIRKSRVGCRGNAELAAEVLCESLRAFESGRGTRGPENLDACRREIVRHSCNERSLGTDHDEVDAVLPAEGCQRVMVGDVQGHALRHLGDPGVSGRAKERCEERAR